MLKLDNGELKAGFGEDSIKILLMKYTKKCKKQDIKHDSMFCPKNYNVDFLNGKNYMLADKNNWIWTLNRE
jgi:hypothetical protein